MTDGLNFSPARSDIPVEQAVDMDFQVVFTDILKGLRKFWWLVILLGFLSAGVVLVFAMLSNKPVYIAEATFTVATTKEGDFSGNDFSFSYEAATVSRMAETFPYILKSDVLQEIIIDDIGTKMLNSTISAAGMKNTNLFTLMVKGPNASDAYDTLESIIKNYPKIAEYIIGDTVLNILEEPSVYADPANSYSKKSTAAKGFIIGVFIGAFVILIYALTRNTIRKVDDIRSKFSQGTLGITPHVAFRRQSDLKQKYISILNNQVSNAFKESIRSLRTHVIQKLNEQENKVVMVTSTISGEGNSIVALNLALSIASTYAKVVLIDANFRRQSVKDLLGLKLPNISLADVIAGRAKLHDAIQECQVPGFYYISGGTFTETPIDMIRSRALRDIIGILRKKADYIIIDTPPCGLFADALTMARLCDSILYIMKQDEANVSQILDSLDSLEYSKISILGCVLNDVKSGFDGYGYNYGYSSDGTNTRYGGNGETKN
jgi:polysaccharide biosynthesis transport protein